MIGAVVLGSLGIVAAVVAPLVQERIRWRREDRRELLNERTAAYVAFSASASAAFAAAQTVSQFRRRAGLVNLVIASYLSARLMRAGDEVTRGIAQVRLLGSREVVDRAERLLWAVGAVEGILRSGGRRRRDKRPWEHLLEELTAARDQFQEAARLELEPLPLSRRSRRRLQAVLPKKRGGPG